MNQYVPVGSATVHVLISVDNEKKEDHVDERRRCVQCSRACHGDSCSGQISDEDLSAEGTSMKYGANLRLAHFL